MTPIVLIAAVAANGAIGRDNHLLWRLKSDMAHFRAATAGLPLVMGRKTFESFGGKPLPTRLNIVASRQPGLSLPGAVVTGSLEAALAIAHAEALRSGAPEIAVLGGADIYAQAMPRADRLLITHVDAEPEADAFFPAIDPAIWTAETGTEHPAGPGDDHPFRVVAYRRTSGGTPHGAAQGPDTSPR
ncbi:dihydrofolate reductase [Phreatobacter cathodiphilus]|uniref:Dihydrofolate reductase n=1 Tax=Phreatobacter cathodiphilus TaxID=1868589 RepID=A0A2S0N680_9HYPH|nr:dihydrofolate reductase [Phreatobacter cathodiphilus]AVO43659.1 diacylglycerol kinase [Phreatobacter cathodiphilus]